MIVGTEPLSSRYAISDELRDQFAKNGHVFLPGVALAGELAVFRPALREAAYRFATEDRKLAERDTYGRAFLQIMNVWRQDPTVKRFVFAKRFAQIAADLLGVEKVRLYHDQALFKEPGGGITPWHQDQYYWPLDTDRTITMWMPLGDITDENGMITFASGSHHGGLVGNIAISDESEKAFASYIATNNFLIAAESLMRAGDATFHLGTTIHRAGENASQTVAREVMTVIYFADGARVTAPQNDEQAADIAAWLSGRSPGEIADGELNPVLN